MLVEFFDHAVERGTTEDGLPKYVDAVYVRIARDVLHTVVREATEEDFENYPNAYKRYQKQERAKSVDGFPLSMWPEVSPAERASLHNQDIYTVQQLAAMPPSQTKKLPPRAGQLVQKAKEFIEVAGDANAVTKKMDEYKDQIASLKEQLQEAQQEIMTLRAQLQVTA